MLCMRTVKLAPQKKSFSIFFRQHVKLLMESFNAIRVIGIIYQFDLFIPVNNTPRFSRTSNETL